MSLPAVSASQARACASPRSWWRAANDAQVWGERFDRDLNDIFALQDEISKAIVTALKLTLLPGEKQALEQRSTTNPEAYKLYLMARQFWLLDNERNNEIVVRICRRVVEIDPNYAQAWATLALAQWNMFWQGDSGDDGGARCQHGIAHRSQPGRFACGHGCRVSQQGQIRGGAAGLPACDEARSGHATWAIAWRDCVAWDCDATTRPSPISNLRLSAMESDFTASTFISQCYKAKGDLDRMRGSTLRAMDRIEKIVMADPGHSRAIGMGVAMLADLGEKERAREWATRARLVDPEAVNLQYNLACAMSVTGGNRPGARGARRNCVEAFTGHGQLARG